VAGEWPFVGRSGELHRLRELISGDPPCGVVVAGPVGVGKTRLAAEGLALAERAGLSTARVTATRSAASVPFGALAPVLPPVLHGEGALVDHRADLLRRSVDALVERAAGRHLVLFVDDAHLLDDASATLVHQLASTPQASVLATLRAGEAAPEPVVALWKDGLAERLDLGGLGTGAVEEVLTAALGGPVDRATATHLAVRCQGNVLFLRELVLGAVRDGALSSEGGIWHLVGPLAPSDRLVELVEARLTGLAAAERAVLEFVSFAEPLGRAELGVLGDPASAGALERRGLLVSRKNGRRLEVGLAQPLYGEVLRARLSAMQVPAIARPLAEALEATGLRRRDDTLRVATWRLETGGGHPDLMVAAAHAARWRYDFALAERLARAALEAGPCFDAALLAAQMASLQNRGGEAEAELSALAAEAADDTQRGLVAISRLDNALLLGRMVDGLQMGEMAKATIADSAWRNEIEAKRAGLVLATQGPAAAAAVAEPLLGRAGGRALVWACAVGAYSYARLGRVQTALDATVTGHAAHLALTQPLGWDPGLHLFVRCEALAHAGRLAESETLASGQYSQGLADRSVEKQCFFAFHLGKVVGDRGHVQTAERYLREAATLWRQVGQPQLAREALIFLALAAALSGQADQAGDTLQELESEQSGPPIFFSATDFHLAQAWAAVAAGDMPAARRLLEDAATQGQTVGDLVGAAAALHGLARLGHAKEVATPLAALGAQMEGELVVARVDHTEALAKGDAKRLLAAAGAFEAMGADLLATEAAADAAVAWRRDGQPKEAAAAERRAGILAGACQGAITPALQMIETRARLTQAEREAALLAAAGRSNKEIADELFLSVRTVENRLQRVYEKLGVSSRADLTDALQISP
jgi:DNA-binding CsgD family transcriptional regulator